MVDVLEFLPILAQTPLQLRSASFSQIATGLLEFLLNSLAYLAKTIFLTIVSYLGIFNMATLLLKFARINPLHKCDKTVKYL